MLTAPRGYCRRMEQFVVVSNRGPLSFTDDNGTLRATRGGGGLVSCLGPAVSGTDATWICGAITDADREAARQGLVDAEGFHISPLVIDEDDYRAFYDVISNSTLWFLFHGLFDATRRPIFDRHWHAAWETYRRVNAAFARAVVEQAPEGVTVLLHDYHLALAATTVREERPDLRTVYFQHTPFCDPLSIRMLPEEASTELLRGLAANNACGFHTERWAAMFRLCCEEVLGSSPRTFVAPAATDVEDICAAAKTDACQREFDRLDGLVGDRQLIVRVDRLELSKNIVRGFLAYDELLRTREDLRGRVVFWAKGYPSRQNLPEYLAYRHEVETVARRVNHTWGTADWTPILFDTEDNFPRSVAALRRADVVLINPVRDGLNLVAKEAALVNERNAVLCLSRESGVWDELGASAIGLNPFDITSTSAALADALALGDDERRDRAERLSRLARERTPEDWLRDQLSAASSTP